MTTKPGQFLRPAHVAKILGMSQASVITLIRRGDIPAIDTALPGSQRPRYKVSPDGFQQFIEARKVVPPPAPARKSRAPRATIPFV